MATETETTTQLVPRFRNDVLVQIFLPKFQTFDQGKEIQQVIPLDDRLQTGERFRWEAGSNISGIGVVTGINGVWHHIRKLT